MIEPGSFQRIGLLKICCMFFFGFCQQKNHRKFQTNSKKFHLSFGLFRKGPFSIELL